MTIIKLKTIANHELTIRQDNNVYYVTDYSLITSTIKSKLSYDTLEKASAALDTLCGKYKEA